MKVENNVSAFVSQPDTIECDDTYASTIVSGTIDNSVSYLVQFNCFLFFLFRMKCGWTKYSSMQLMDIKLYLQNLEFCI